MDQVTTYIAQVYEEPLFPEPSGGNKLFTIILFLGGTVLLIFHLWMLINCLTQPIRNKVLWFFIIFLLGPLGSIVYFFTGRKNLKTADTQTGFINPNITPPPVPPAAS